MQLLALHQTSTKQIRLSSGMAPSGCSGTTKRTPCFVMRIADVETLPMVSRKYTWRATAGASAGSSCDSTRSMLKKRAWQCSWCCFALQALGFRRLWATLALHTAARLVSPSLMAVQALA